MDRRRLVAATAAAGLAAAAGARAARAQARRPIGRVAVLAGRATAGRPGSGEVELREGAPVFAGDLVRTGPDGRVRVACFGGVVVTVGPLSEVDVARLVAGPGTGLAATFRLLAGIVRLVGGAPAGPTEIAVETPNALAAVRSTDWLVEVRDGGRRTGVLVVLGRVEVRRAGAGGDLPVSLGPGEGTDVIGAQPPRPPVRWGEARAGAALALTEL